MTHTGFALTRAFNGYAEVDGETWQAGLGDLLDWRITARYPDGRIQERTETAAGVTTVFGYTYDPFGRLLTVTRDGVLVEEYRYDAAGTREYEMNALRNIPGRSFTYSVEDHLYTAGETAYD